MPPRKVQPPEQSNPELAQSNSTAPVKGPPLEAGTVVHFPVAVVGERTDRRRHELESIKVQGGKKFYTYREVLDYAHQNGLVGFRQLHDPILETIHYPGGNLMPIAVCSVSAVFLNSDGSVEEYHGTGDATPDNVTGAVGKHLVRMADTRAKARALGDALNLDANFVEEMAEDGAAPTQQPAQRAAAPSNVVPFQKPAPAVAKPAGSDAACEGADCTKTVKANLVALSKRRNDGKVLCIECEKKAKAS